MSRKKSYITVTDQFCGAGGSSQGAQQAASKFGGGVEIKLALNHWKLAIETHQTNFPNTIHDCTDVSACDPRRYPSTDILITSPECTNHSLAKGKKQIKAQLDLYDQCKLDPAAERSRATMWDVPRFAEYHRYNIIIVENVIDARKWVMFDSWVMAMMALGYKHKCVYLNSMHCHPTPQSRDRMYVVFWKKGNKAPDLELNPAGFCSKCMKDVLSVQVWKNPKIRFGKYRQQYVYACPSCNAVVEPYYYAAFNAIDWSIRGERIGDRKRPLKPASVKRIRYGLDKHGKNPLIITTRYTSGVDCRVKNAFDDPLGTQPGDKSHAVVNSPYFVYLSHTNAGEKRAYPAHEAMKCQTVRQDYAIVQQPFITYGEHSKANDGMNVSSSAEAIRTQTTRQTVGVVSPPPFIVSRPHGHKEQMRASGIDESIPTQTTGLDHGLFMAPAFIIEQHRTGKARGMDESLNTATAGGVKSGLVQTPFIVENFGNSKSRPITKELGTQMTKGKYGLLTLESFASFIGYYYGGSSQASSMAEVLGSCTTLPRHFKVDYQPGEIKIEDCFYRMLRSHEVGNAMAFESTYKVLGTERDRVKQFGNAVTPPAMRMLVERCIESLR